jgi:hypothetical protein
MLPERGSEYTRRVMNRAALLLTTVVILAPALARADAASDAIYAPIQLEVGTWDASITFYENDKPTSKGTGVQVNTLLVNGHWIVNQFNVPAAGKFPAYEGHGVWGYDPVARTYVDTWVDTNDSSVRTDYGYWDAATSTMTWSAKQPDGAGHFIDYRMVEQFKGATRTLTMYQLGMTNSTAHPLVKIVFTRRKT